MNEFLVRTQSHSCALMMATWKMNEPKNQTAPGVCPPHKMTMMLTYLGAAEKTREEAENYFAAKRKRMETILIPSNKMLDKSALMGCLCFVFFLHNHRKAGSQVLPPARVSPYSSLSPSSSPIAIGLPTFTKYL